MRSIIKKSPPLLLIRLILLLLIGTLLPQQQANADDIGINSARLIQINDSTYIFETDFSQLIIMDYEAPFFPSRFNVSEPELDINQGWITIRLTITTSGDPLNDKDEIFLPWRRNGVSLTVKWLDGTISQGLFLREIDGIHLPIKKLMSSEKSWSEVSLESTRIGFNHSLFNLVHIIFVIGLFFFLPKGSLLKGLFYFAIGQAVAVPLLDLGFGSFDLLFIDLVLLLVSVSLVVTTIQKKDFPLLNILLLVLGILHGLSLGVEIELLGYGKELTRVGLFMCGFVISAFQFLVALFLLFFNKLFFVQKKWTVIGSYLLGICAVFSLLSSFNNQVVTGKTDILVEKEEDFNESFSELTGQSPSRASSKIGAMQMTSPAFSYLSIEPFEIRHEILITAEAALELLDMSTRGMSDIPESLIPRIKEELVVLFLAETSVAIDGISQEPIITQVDFVSLGLAGVIIHTEDQVEPLAGGILGISLIYETERLAEDIKLNWGVFSATIIQVESSTVDPFGEATYVLTLAEQELNWKSAFSAYTVPSIEEIAIESPKLPIVSIVLLLASIVIAILVNKGKAKKQTAVALFSISLLAYPFIQTPVGLDIVKQWKPSEERAANIAEALLSNVYRSFDYRDESDVYDRLAISVVGDQLSRTYIEQRRGLEIENRGGAKAKVNEVDVLEVADVTSQPNSSYSMEVQWQISGSVSHFGHMHYRQNIYRAIVWIRPDDGNWKIENMEIISEERIM